MKHNTTALSDYLTFALRSHALPIFLFGSIVMTVVAAPAPAEIVPGVRPSGPRLPVESYTYKTTAGLAIRASVFRPPDQEVRPVILWLHGGALIQGGRSDLREDQCRRYLEAGYVVVAIDYRLAPETKLNGISEDLQDAYRWLRTDGPALFRIDPDRVAIVGHSAGGYLALLAGYALTPRPKAVVAFYGFGDIAGEWCTTPSPFYNRQAPIARADALRAVADHPVVEDLPKGRGRYVRFLRQQGQWTEAVTGNGQHLTPQALTRYCPLRNITHVYPPTFLLHGDLDTDVPVEQSVLLAAEFTRQGVEHRFLRHPDWSHGFDGIGTGMKDPDIARTFDQVIEFLDRHLQPAGRSGATP